MDRIKNFILLFIFSKSLFAQFPIDLEPDETSSPIIYNAEDDTEYILTLIASSNTNWAMSDSESATLVIAIDGNWQNYNQDIVLYAGNVNHKYDVSLGYLSAGEHSIEFKFDSNKSTIGAENIHIDSAEIQDISFVEMFEYINASGNNLYHDPDVFLYSPVLYGRDLLSWNESTHTDIPLILFYSIEYDGPNKKITYSIIFSNEDSRVGIGLADLMFNYGRTTDIEWMYEVTLNNEGEIVSEIFQGPSHTTTSFNGEKIDKHPILKNATLNCNFTDSGISDYKFFLSPIHYIPSSINNSPLSREFLMDMNPWTYRIMAEELFNEERYEQIANPETVDMSDVRNYIYIEYYEPPPAFQTNGDNITLDLIVKLYGDCKRYFHTHNSELFSSTYNAGINRTSIEIPENFNPEQIEYLQLVSSADGDYNIGNLEFNLFYLDNTYNPIYFNNINSSVPILSNEYPVHTILINENFMNIDCLGIEDGNAECDSCDVCNGNDLDIDDCGICFGNNINMDCSGMCFGSSIIDDCGVCDNDPTNDNLTCSGCTDINAENYDDTAMFYDGNCIYSDNLFLVPTEYTSIQDAIFYSSDGDTVQLDEGIYYENINFLSKGITLKGENSDYFSSYIIGVDSLSTITIENSFEGSLIDLKISNGYGRGVSFDDFISLAAEPSAFDSLVTNVLRGGGISIINSNIYIKNLDVTDNVSRNVGAGIGIINSSVTIESSKIANNYIPDGDALGGGGIAINGGEVTILDSDISDNSVGTNLYSLNGGGGILCGFSFGENPLSLNMYNTTIFNNDANVGGGIGALSGNIHIERSILNDNVGDYGSAISMGEPLGLVVGDIHMNLINSTITNNTGLLTTGLINSAYLNILNSIFWNNNGDYEFSSMPNNNQLNIEGYYSIFENELIGEGNLSLDPLFSSEEYPFGLLPNSPAIDAGIDSFNFNNEIIHVDSYYGDAPDIGAYEFQDCNANPSGDLNGDSNLDILDVLSLVGIIMGTDSVVWDEVCFVDMNQDDILDIFDIIIMINMILSPL